MVGIRKIKRFYVTAVLLVIAMLGLAYRLYFVQNRSSFQASSDREDSEMSAGSGRRAVVASRSGKKGAMADDTERRDGRKDNPVIRHQQQAAKKRPARPANFQRYVDSKQTILEENAVARGDSPAEARNARLLRDEDSAVRNAARAQERYDALRNVGRREEEPNNPWRNMARKPEPSDPWRNRFPDSDNKQRNNERRHPEAEEEDSNNAERNEADNEFEPDEEHRHANEPGKEEGEEPNEPPPHQNAADDEDVANKWKRVKNALRLKVDDYNTDRAAKSSRRKSRTIDIAGEPVTRPPLELFRLHRSFSVNAISSGNVYADGEAERVAHVAVFCQADDFTAILTLVNSVVRNSASRNLTFHFVTPQSDAKNLKGEMEKNNELKKLAFEVIEYPKEWTHGKDMMEFASFRLPELLPFMKGKVAVLDPYSLVTGDIVKVLSPPILEGHWAAMATLCKQSLSDTTPDRRYKHYLNFSHPLIAKLDLPPDTCAPSGPGFLVANLSQLSKHLVRPQLWGLVRLNDKAPVFLKPVSTAAYSIVFNNHTTVFRPRTYVRLNEKSQVPDGRAMVYHWVGKGKPWDKNSPAAGLWKKFFIPASSSAK